MGYKLNIKKSIGFEAKTKKTQKGLNDNNEEQQCKFNVVHHTICND